jgi:hypothetical protein
MQRQCHDPDKQAGILIGSSGIIADNQCSSGGGEGGGQQLKGGGGHLRMIYAWRH